MGGTKDYTCDKPPLLPSNRLWYINQPSDVSTYTKLYECRNMNYSIKDYRVFNVYAKKEERVGAYPPSISLPPFSMHIIFIIDIIL